jgi:hypothetical protein
VKTNETNGSTRETITKGGRIYDVVTHTDDGRTSVDFHKEWKGRRYGRVFTLKGSDIVSVIFKDGRRELHPVGTDLATLKDWSSAYRYFSTKELALNAIEKHASKA